MIHLILVETIIEDSEHYEYFLTLNDGMFRLNCCTHRGEFLPGTEFDNEISAYGLENIYKIASNKPFISVHESSGKQHIHAKVIDTLERIVQVGAYKIWLLENVIPKDILDGDFIEFDVDCLVIY